MNRTIGDLAKHAGVGVETIRFYEREGLIEQPDKPPRGSRRYTVRIARQLGLVRLARQAGLSLADARRLKGAARAPQASFCAETLETLKARLAAVEAEITQLETRRAALQSWLAHCATQQPDAPCPLYHQIRALIATATAALAIALCTPQPAAAQPAAAQLAATQPATARPAAAQSPTARPDTAQALVARFARAWNAADPVALSQLFAPAADLVAPDGLEVTGRQNIARYYAAAFANGYAASHGAGQIMQQRTVAPGLTLIDGRFTISFQPTTRRPQTGMVTLLLENGRILAWRERAGTALTPFPPAR